MKFEVKNIVNNELNVHTLNKDKSNKDESNKDNANKGNHNKANKMNQDAVKAIKWCMVIDIAKCENCNNCFLACKDEHYGNEWDGYSTSQPLHGQRWMNILRKEHGEFPYIKVAYLPKPCFHCEDADCITYFNNTHLKDSGSDKTDKIAGSIYKRNDGIVIIDPKKAKGDKSILKSCPHGAIWWNEEKQVAQKCTLCAHLLDDEWKAPRCVQACPTGALTFHAIEIDQFDNFIASNNLQNFSASETVSGKTESGKTVSGKTESGKTMSNNIDGNIGIDEHKNVGIADHKTEEDAKTNHNCVLYKNLHLYNRCFIAGSVATRKSIISESEEIFIEDCVKNASVEMYHDGKLVAQTTTNAFGDYWFEELPENSGVYEIKIINNMNNYEPIKVTLGKSCYLGVFWI